MHEKAWYFSAGDSVPEWLQRVKKGDCALSFGVNVVVTSKEGGYEVRPQCLDDNPGPIMVVKPGRKCEHIDIEAGGRGVNLVSYSCPNDKTSGDKIAYLKKLLEEARPYVECYDTREHNSEQDAVLTEIDKALSVVLG